MNTFAKKQIHISPLLALSIIMLICSLASCEGAFDWVYDKAPAQERLAPVQDQIYLDASDWKTWYYFDLPSAAASIKTDSLHDASQDIVAMSIPLEATGETETERGDHQHSGQYLYYFDVFNEGITNNHFVSYTPTASQPSPESWTIAIHRNNVRTNGCAAYETVHTDINQPTHADAEAITRWQEDQWSEKEVWDDQSTMLSSHVPSQGIKINPVLSSWLQINIPPMPPTYMHNNHVMLLRLPDGTYGALQLTDYLSPTNKKCCLTIKYKYPL